MVDIEVVSKWVIDGEVDIEVGEQVKVTHETGEVLIGEVTDITEEMVEVNSVMAGAAVQIQRSDIEDIEII